MQFNFDTVIHLDSRSSGTVLMLSVLQPGNHTILHCLYKAGLLSHVTVNCAFVKSITRMICKFFFTPTMEKS
jgi:hypothetical protein